MKNKIAAVHKFHTAFKLNIQDTPTVDISEDRKKIAFRVDERRKRRIFRSRKKQ